MAKSDAFFAKLTPKQEAFVVAYLDEYFLAGAASEAGISYKTAQRWLASPDVQDAIAHLRQERRELRENRLAACLDMAIGVLYDNLECASNPEEAERTHNWIDHKLEFQYVALMLKYASDQREIDALRARIAQLEAQAEASSSESVEGSITRLPVPVRAHTRFL